MAISYTPLFEDLGEIIEGVNIMVNDSTDWLDELSTGFTAIADEYTSNGIEELLDNLNTTINSVKDSVVSMAGALSNLVDKRLLHSSVVDELPELGTNVANVNKILAELALDMIENSQSIAHLGGVSLDTDTKTGFDIATRGSALGQSYMGALLVGGQIPSSSWPLIPAYAYDSTNVLSALYNEGETFTLECTSDSVTGTTQEGNETFRVTGINLNSTPWTYKTDGIGTGPTMTSFNGPSANYVFNGDFENWVIDPDMLMAACPDNFEVRTGTCGVDIIQATETANVRHGLSSLKLMGNSGASVSIRQRLDANKFQSHTNYFLGCWRKKITGTTAGAISFSLVDGDGTVQSVGSAIAEGHATIGTGWGMTIGEFAMSGPISNPLYLLITWTGAASTDVIWVDYMGMSKAIWHGGISMSVWAGANKFLIGDRLDRTITKASGSRGVFQDFFREKYHIQLPYDASPSISDTLATD